MGLTTTTTNLSYARNELIKVGASFTFDKVADMIYYFVKNCDVATTYGSRTSGSGLDLGTYEAGISVAAQYTDSATLINTTDYVGCAGIFDLKLGRAITLASGGGYGFATIWANLEVDKAINATGAQSAAWMTIWADASGDDAHIRGSSRLQVLDLAIVTGADFDASASTKIYGLRIDSSANASATMDGEFAAINIEAAGVKKDWTIGIDLNGCTTGIDVGAATTGINVTGACTTAFNVSVVQSVNTGLNAATVLQHGSYSTALAYGTATSGRLLLRVMNITAAGTAVSVMGDFLKITSSATSTGSLFGHYGYISLGHDTTGAYAMKARLELTASSALGLVSGMLITTGISGTTTLTSGTNAHISGLHIGMSIASAVVDVAQEVMGLYVQTTGIVKDVTGNKIGIKVEHGGSGNYLDYGLQFSNCFDTATAVVHFELTQCTTACAILFETTTHTLTSALKFKATTGGTTYFADFSDATVNLPMSKESSAKSSTCQGWISVLDTDGTIGYINVWAS